MLKIFGVVILTEKEFERNMKAEFLAGEKYGMEKKCE